MFGIYMDVCVFSLIGELVIQTLSHSESVHQFGFLQFIKDPVVYFSGRMNIFWLWIFTHFCLDIG